MNALVQEFNQSHPGQVDFLAIPTNNFGLQEPGANDEILNGLEHVRPGEGFKPMYKLGVKNNANGDDADPLFVFLKDSCPAPQKVMGSPSSYYFSPISNGDITWNFEKFLVDQKGQPYKRYTPDAYPLGEMRTDILFLLNKTQEFEASEDDTPVENVVLEEAEPKVVEEAKLDVAEKPVANDNIQNDVVKEVPVQVHKPRRRPHRVRMEDLIHRQNLPNH